MIIDIQERGQMENAKLALICPEAYEAKIKAQEKSLINDIISFFKKFKKRKK